MHLWLGNARAYHRPRGMPPVPGSPRRRCSDGSSKWMPRSHLPMLLILRASAPAVFRVALFATSSPIVTTVGTFSCSCPPVCLRTCVRVCVHGHIGRENVISGRDERWLRAMHTIFHGLEILRPSLPRCEDVGCTSRSSGESTWSKTPDMKERGACKQAVHRTIARIRLLAWFGKPMLSLRGPETGSGREALTAGGHMARTSSRNLLLLKQQMQSILPAFWRLASIVRNATNAVICGATRGVGDRRPVRRLDPARPKRAYLLETQEPGARSESCDVPSPAA